MNKKLTIIKNILLLLNITLLTYFYTTVKSVPTTKFLIYTLLLIFLIITSIKDFSKKHYIDKKYNILFILMEMFMNLIILRALFDPSFIYNSKHYMQLITNNNPNYTIEQYMYIVIWYLDQNLWYFIIMILGMIIYRRINLNEVKESKYSRVSIACLIISMCTILKSIQCLNDLTNPYLYLLFNTILIAVEIFELIKNNHKKKEWIIYLSFIFNLLGFISIYISIFI